MPKVCGYFAKNGLPLHQGLQQSVKCCGAPRVFEWQQRLAVRCTNTHYILCISARACTRILCFVKLSALCTFGCNYILRKMKPKGVVHCFSGSKEMAREIIKIGMYIGLNGVATFKNARKSLEVVKEIPLERLVLETDCPYLAPEPHRGKRNDSSYIPYIAMRIGEVLNMDAQEILNITTQNAKRLYGVE